MESDEREHEQARLYKTCDEQFIQHVKNNNLKLVASSLKGGANIHYCDDAALQLCGPIDHLEILAILLENGANVHANNGFILEECAGAGNIEGIKRLLECGRM